MFSRLFRTRSEFWLPWRSAVLDVADLRWSLFTRLTSGEESAIFLLNCASLILLTRPLCVC